MEIETNKKIASDGSSSEIETSLHNFASDPSLCDTEKKKKSLLLHKKRTQKISSESESDNEHHDHEATRVKNQLVNSSRKDNVKRPSSDDPISSPVRSKSKIGKATVTDDSDSDSKIPAEGSPKTYEESKTSKVVASKNQSVRSPDSNLTNNSENISVTIPINYKSRIKKFTDDSDSDSKNSPKPVICRIKGKSNNLQQKFKSLSQMQDKGDATNKIINSNSSSDDEAASIDKTKQRISMHFKSTICDPDTSDEENSLPKTKSKLIKDRKSTKLSSAKPQRMSAKQAMENMQKIKSESNRMLREKEVSLPYHRPKALSLKDIMSRRRPALSVDGKALPIKMNEEQLKQYAVMLEQRQKEIMELCKSESEEEAENNENKIANTEKDETTETNTKNLETRVYENTELIQSKNDLIFDDVCLDNKSSLEEKIASSKDVTDELSGNENKDIDRNEEVCDDKDVDPTLKNDRSKKESNGFDAITETNVSVVNAATEMITETETKACDNSAEMELTYNVSVENNEVTNSNNVKSRHVMSVNEEVNKELNSVNSVNTKIDSQLISLHFDSEKTDTEKLDQIESISKEDIIPTITAIQEENIRDETHNTENDDLIVNKFSDDDLRLEDIDMIIENAEILSQNKTENTFSPMLIRESQPLTAKPKLTGAPGMVIDLDGTDPSAPKKSGVELLKERFTYFSRLKTPDEIEREREKRVKPGMQHLKLKQQLEDQIAEQRSLEWAKRLEEEKQHQKETEAVIGKESDAEDDIDKIDAKLDEMEVEQEEEEGSSESQEEEEETTDTIEKPRKRNPLVDDEAEESDYDDAEDKEAINEDNEETNIVETDENDADEKDEDDKSEESSDEESEHEENEKKKPKKGRILRAFEDSDDEEVATKNGNISKEDNIEKTAEKCLETIDSAEMVPVNNVNVNEHPVIKDTQDEVIQLAQRHKSYSEDLFTSQESAVVSLEERQKINSSNDEKLMDTQTFSILNSDIEVVSDKFDVPVPDNLFEGPTQNIEEGNLDHVVGMCSGSFSQSLVTSQFPETQKSLNIGEDVLALCTGKFYDSKFVSQLDDDEKYCGVSQNNDSSKANTEFSNENIDDNIKESIEYMHTCSEDTSKNISQNVITIEEIETLTSHKDDDSLQNTSKYMIPVQDKKETDQKSEDNVLLKSILDELHDPEFDSRKPMKYFGDDDHNKDNNAVDMPKKRFVIDSDDEDGSKDVISKKKKFKKKKMEKRALHISDDEEDENKAEESEAEEISEIENEDNEERTVEYDSEENEIVIQPEIKKKKRKVADFFEQEAELTSEDEWAGSGDEDERGLDCMEREEGDDERFNQTRLQRELEQIHMRDVLDQDKREVRMIQELLFEDGDLGGGGRQRKFRWRNADDGDENDPGYEITDTQEEEFESEEQWRKQRYEREMFLKQLKQQDEEDESLNTSVNRTSLIKANLTNRGSLSSILIEMNETKTEVVEKAEHATVLEKKTSKDIPSPKKPFAMFQPNMHNSLLSRGRGALARLASLALPLAGDDGAPSAGSLAPSSKRNFVFAAITPDEDAPKVTTKRKAETSVGTPQLVKKMKTDEKKNYSRSSLLDHLNC